MGNNDTGEQLAAARTEVVRLEREVTRLNAALAASRGLPPLRIGEVLPLPAGTQVVSDFASHAVMAQPNVPGLAAIPVVQLEFGLVAALTPSAPRSHITLLVERSYAAPLAAAIQHADRILVNLRDNQERPSSDPKSQGFGNG